MKRAVMWRIPAGWVMFLLLVAPVDRAVADDWVILPVFGSQPDTGFQYGTAAFWQAGDQPDDYGADLFAIATAQGQVRGLASVRVPGVVQGRSDVFTVSLNGADFPSTFYGYRATFTPHGTGHGERSFGAELDWSYPLGPSWRARLGTLVQTERIRFSNPTDPVLDGIEGLSGGETMGLVMGLERDTRVDSGWPVMGMFLDSEVTLARHSVAGPFVTAAQSGAWYQQLQPDWILAVGGQVQAATGSTPFTRMPTLSGSRWLRGETDGRYRHQTTVAQQVELRWALTNRIATAGFLHQGQVGESPADWWDTAWKQGGGLGLRYSISDEQRQNIRVDLGWVDGRGGLVISFGEAF